MIRNSFVFLEKVSKKKEQNIWQQGIKNWQDFLKTEKIKGISVKSKFYYDRRIKKLPNWVQEKTQIIFRIGMLQRKVYH
jgi:hypothetical protein